MVSKLFKKLVNNGIVGHPEKCGLFLISSMVLGLLDQLQIFSQLYLIELLGLLTRFDMLVFFTNLSLMEFQVRCLALFLIFSLTDDFGWFWMKSSQEYPVNAGVSQGSSLGRTLFWLYINDLTDNVICNIAIYADDTTL